MHYGLNAEVEVTPSRDPVFHSLQTPVNGSFTNIEKGIELASSLIPSSDRKRVVLVTDGVETAGDALKPAGMPRTARYNGGDTHMNPVESSYAGR